MDGYCTGQGKQWINYWWVYK